MNSKPLLIFIGLLIIATIYVYWPERTRMAEGPPPLTVEAAQALSDDTLVGAVVVDQSHYIFRDGYDAKAWTTMPEESKAVWVSATIELRLRTNGFIYYLITRDQESPDLAALRDAYIALGEPALAKLVDEAITIEKGPGAGAITACRDYFRENHLTPFARPPGFVDPFARAEKAYIAAVTTSGIEQKRLAYTKQHLEAILAPSSLAR
jgi:hypothetical protein